MGEFRWSSATSAGRGRAPDRWSPGCWPRWWRWPGCRWRRSSPRRPRPHRPRPRRIGGRRRAPARERDPGREPAARQPRVRVAGERLGRPVDPGLHDRHQRRPRRDRVVQGRPRRVGARVPHRHLPARLVRRRRRPQGGDHPVVADHLDRPASVPTTTRPAWSTAAAGPCRRRGRCPADAVSGIYIGRLVRDDTGGASHVPFVVRNDAGHSALLFQTSDTTWQAYNTYGGNSLYKGSGLGTGGQADGRAYKVSYNRPITVRAGHPRGQPLQRRVPDAAVARAQRLRHQLHDRRRHRPLGRRAARAPGVHVGRPRRVLVRASSGPTSRPPAMPACTWPSSAATRCSGRPGGRARSTAPARPYRTLVSYKETHDYPNNPDPTTDVDGHLARPP